MNRNGSNKYKLKKEISSKKTYKGKKKIRHVHKKYSTLYFVCNKTFHQKIFLQIIYKNFPSKNNFSKKKPQKIIFLKKY